jgi:hypothetical protein
MDSKYVRKTIDDLLEDLRRDPRIGRRPGLLARYGRPLGFSAALGLGAVAGCADGSNVQDGATADAAQDTAGRELLPMSADAYGLASDSLPTPDAGPDLLPPPSDAYGIAGDLYPAVDKPDGEVAASIDALPRTEDALPALDFAGDIYAAPPPDARDALPPSGDLYGAAGDRISNPGAADAKNDSSFGD